MTTRADRGLYWQRALSLVEGCSPVSPGCAHCWSAAATHMRAQQDNPRIAARYAMLTRNSGDFNGIVRFQADALGLPERTRKPTRWAVWNDLFHECMPAERISMICEMMERCKEHTFCVLTKRAARLRELFVGREILSPTERLVVTRIQFNLGWPRNIWLGVTCEDQRTADERIKDLQATPAIVRWLSVEPLLERIDLRGLAGISWVVVGAETGPHRRPCDLGSVQSVVEQCDHAHVPVWVKALEIDGKITTDLSRFPAWAQRRELPEGTP